MQKKEKQQPRKQGKPGAFTDKKQRERRDAEKSVEEAQERKRQRKEMRDKKDGKKKIFMKKQK